ncbi:MAG: glycerate kinase [Bacteroidota bacterium]
MKILIACDKFKGSLSAPKVCAALAEGLLPQDPDMEILHIPLADGGDGSLDIIAADPEAQLITLPTVDPLGRHMHTRYAILGSTAWIEVAAASGLVLLNEQERSAMDTHTIGTGRLIADALRRGIRDIVLMAGGSATNDAGLGILLALGFRFLNKKDRPLDPTGRHLRDVVEVQLPEKLPAFRLRVLTDVTNPFSGPNGAAHVYAAQKGASPVEIEQLDKGLEQLAGVMQRQFGVDLNQVPGAGAAGGLAGGLKAALGAELQSGFEAFSEKADLATAVQWADLVISGEGRFDEQSLQGKVVGGVLDLCRNAGKPLIVVTGQNSLNAPADGIKQVYDVLNMTGGDIAEAMSNPESYLTAIGHMIGSSLQT